MKCITCNGELKKKEVEHKELGVSLGKFPALVCTKCNEVFYDEISAERIQKKSKELGLFGMAKKTKVAMVGNSLAIRIPKEIAKFVDLKKEEIVKLIPKSNKEILIEV
ncbi:MAG: AbrB/MazE/SpoVT family DNA-binding domain-containing protein [Candidatus Woesearchaeota archaeon]